MNKAKLFLNDAKESPRIWTLLNKNTIKTVMVILGLMLIVSAFTGLQSPIVQGILASTIEKILIFVGIVLFALGYNVQKIRYLKQNKPELFQVLLLEPRQYRIRAYEFIKPVVYGIQQGNVSPQSKEVVQTIVRTAIKKFIVLGSFYLLVAWSFLKLTEFHLLINIVVVVFLVVYWLFQVFMKSFDGAFEEHGLKN